MYKKINNCINIPLSWICTYEYLQILRFWALSIVLSLSKSHLVCLSKHNVSETGFCLCLQVRQVSRFYPRTGILPGIFFHYLAASYIYFRPLLSVTIQLRHVNIEPKHVITYAPKSMQRENRNENVNLQTFPPTWYSCSAVSMNSQRRIHAKQNNCMGVCPSQNIHCYPSHKTLWSHYIMFTTASVK
jgi:hypothetical protein